MSKKDDTSKVSQEELEAMLQEAEEIAQQKDAQKTQEEISKIDKTQEVQQLQDQLLRVQAEMANFRQRTEREKAAFVQYAAKNVVLELLPVLDTFKMAIVHTPEHIRTDNWAIGIHHLEKQFESALENVGVKKIVTTGNKIDYSLHEAIEEVEGEKDIIVEEVQAGYVLNGVVVRVAKVKVGRGEIGK